MVSNLELLDKIIVGRVEPNIYAFETSTIPNYLKIGDTHKAVSERINEWRKYFPNLKKVFENPATIDENTYFRDFSVHKYVEFEKQRSRLEKGDLPPETYYSKEFFKNANCQDIIDAIDDIKKNYIENTNKYDYYSSSDRLPAIYHYIRNQNYEPRPNQLETISRFKEAYVNGRTNLLMYAVMRFGKSFTSMCCALEMSAKLVVIVSAKVDVAEEWKHTVESHVKFEDYEFLLSSDLKRNPNIIDETLEKKSVVVFLSLQDLQGSTIKDKHQNIFGRQIDLLLIDETHFAARAQKYGQVLDTGIFHKDVDDKDPDSVDFELADRVIKRINSKIRIHLSGTPYRILMSNEFQKEDIIAFYQFTDIVNEQEKWDEENVLKDDCKEWDNPYFGFPQMIRFAFRPNKTIRNQLENLKKNGCNYTLSELLKPLSISKDNLNDFQKFKYEKEVLDFLKIIDGSEEDENILSFLDNDRIKNGMMCRHIVIVLPYRASCDALENVIVSNKKVFKNLQNYNIINISGLSIDKKYQKTDEIKKEIHDFEEKGEMTITLTVNRMLTGSTVPEWDTMIFLKDTASPQEYDQATFRIQNQYVKSYADANGNVIKINKKPQTLLVDFNPDRLFRIQELKSKIYNISTEKNGNDHLWDRLNEELKISPIITINKDKIVEVEAHELLRFISDYNNNKGIKEEVHEMPVDLNLFNINEIREIIDRENEIDSKSGLSYSPYENEDQTDEFDIPEEDRGENGEKSPSHGEEYIGNQTENNDEKINEAKFRSYYVRLLLYSFITDDKVSSLNDIIKTIDSEDNKRIIKNVGLNKKGLSLIVKNINPWVLSAIDYKIQDINDLSLNKGLGLRDKLNVIVNKFGKIGDAIVLTPSDLTDKIVDKIFRNIDVDIKKEYKFLDIASTIGEFASSLYIKMKSIGFEDKSIENSIYSITKSPLCYELTRKIYSMLGLNVDNIIEKYVAEDLLSVKRGSVLDCQKIRKLILKDIKFKDKTLSDEVGNDNMICFDGIVGNPPYQQDDSGAGSSATPIYNYFVDIAKAIDPKVISLIIPTRWFTGGKELDDFRKTMLEDKHIQTIDDYLHPEEIFPDSSNRGGVCFFLRNINYDNEKSNVTVVTHDLGGVERVCERPMKTGDLGIFIRDGRSISIINKVTGQMTKSIQDIMSGRNPFGLASNFTKIGKDGDLKEGYHLKSDNLDNPVICCGKGKSVGYVERNFIKKNTSLIDKWKVLVPRADNIGTELNDDNLNSFVLAPNSVCTEAYILVGSNIELTEETASNLAAYLKTKFARYLHGLTKASHDATSKTFMFVPVVDYSKSWSDEELYHLYELSDDEINVIETTIKEMD